MTIEQWAIKQLKVRGLLSSIRTTDVRWGKAYKYSPGKGLEIIPIRMIEG